MTESKDILKIVRVENGWLVHSGERDIYERTHVYVNPELLANHVKNWAVMQSLSPKTILNMKD